MIAELSEGAMRDALSILERCIQDGDNKTSESKIRELIGIPKEAMVHNLTKSIIDYNIDEALNAINDVLEDGKDINNLLWEVIKYIKDILLIKTNAHLSIYNQEELENIKALAGNITKERAVNLIYNLSELENNMKWSTQKLIMFQAGIIKLCNKEAESSTNSNASNNAGSGLEARVEKIENYLKSGGGVRMQASAPKETKPRMVANTESKATTKSTPAKAYSGKAQEAWPRIIDDLKGKGKMTLYANLLNTSAVEINDMTVGIQFPNGLTSFGKTVLEKQENTKIISDMVSIAMGKEMHIKYMDSGKQEAQSDNNVANLENFANGFDIPFNIED
jgi:DNA polymerase-3 subunit gamma/tau